LADLIKAQHSIDVELVPGKRGELSVWVNGTMVAEKNASGWPAEATVLARVGEAIRAV
jgi:predicted Rdx family selenoprotein